MRCLRCDFPLSPTRTSCPRCGEPTSGGSDANNNRIVVSEQPSPERQSLPQQTWGTDLPFATNIPQLPFPPSPGLEANAAYGAPTAQGPVFPMPYAPMTQQPALDAGSFPPSPMGAAAYPAQQASPQASAPRQPIPGTFSPPAPLSRANVHTTYSAQRGFTLAGLCVLIGGLILLAVYLLSLSLPSSSPAPSSPQQTLNSPNLQSTQANSSPSQVPSPTTTPETNTPVPTTSMTNTLPGKSYIDNAKTASAINTTTIEPLQLTSTFKVHQQIFVVFSLHPQGQTGAVCLLWYVNGQQFNHYQFPVTSLEQPGYSYTYANSPGAASLEIYWASTTTCADKQLAQRVTFTVTQ